jgi:hypothetical protein
MVTKQLEPFYQSGLGALENQFIQPTPTVPFREQDFAIPEFTVML